MCPCPRNRGNFIQRAAAAAESIDKRLAQIGWSTNIDCSMFDLDAPMGEFTTNGHRQSRAQFLRKAGKRTLRKAIVSYTGEGEVKSDPYLLHQDSQGPSLRWRPGDVGGQAYQEGCSSGEFGGTVLQALWFSQ